MLPKFATTFLHHTSRAVAAVQGQTGYAFRNVLQSSSGGTTTANWTGASSSGWGGAGAGAGGAKYHSSSRFYGYTGAGRSLTQANQSSVNDIGSSQNDDEDINLASGVHPTPLRYRARSNSLSINPQGKADRADKLGVLKIVSIHARESHAFAPNHADEPEAPRSTLVRRNSTSSATTSGSPPSSNVEIPPSPMSRERHPVDFLDPMAPQTVIPPPLEQGSEEVLTILQGYNRMEGSINIITYVRTLIENDMMPDEGRIYNLALQALLKDHVSVGSVKVFMRVYKTMKKKGHIPASWNQALMIQALGIRDLEVQRSIRTLILRTNRRKVGNRASGKQHEFDLKQLEKFTAEDNFGPATKLFQDAIASSMMLPRFVYTMLLRSCSLHCDELTALPVFAHLEKRYRHQIPIAAFYYLLSIYAKLRNLDSALETFNEFKKALSEGRICMRSDSDGGDLMASDNPWNKMIEVYFNCGQPTEALSLLEEMMDSKSGYPLPSAATYQTIISGFCQNGDVNTGLSWFRRLLMEETSVSDPYKPLDKPPRPDSYMFRDMICTLVDNEMIPEVIEVFDVWLDNHTSNETFVNPVDRLLVAEAILRCIDDHPERTMEADSVFLDYILHRVAPDTKKWHLVFGTRNSHVCSRIIQIYERHGQIDNSVRLLISFFNDQELAISEDAGTRIAPMQRRMWLRELVFRSVERLLTRHWKQLTFAQATDLVDLLSKVSLTPSVDAGDAYLAVFEAGKVNGTIGILDARVVKYLVSAGATLVTVVAPNRDHEIAARLARFESLLAHIPTHFKEVSDLGPSVFSDIIRALFRRYPISEQYRVFERLGPTWHAVWNYSVFQDELSRMTNAEQQLTSYVSTETPPITSPDSRGSPFTFSEELSRSIDECLCTHGNDTHAESYAMFMSSYRNGVYPQPETIGHLINALGRVQEIEKVRFVYEVAQHALSVQAQNGTPDPSAWSSIESDMIIALSHAGDVDGAHFHRHRMLQSGRAPSADAYGALIRCVKDTTDDSSIAQELFRESGMNGIVPNVYLFNTMISKLAKARKASQAMELFEQMKAHGYWPSSVTYGAVIGACSRVGDYNTADRLFKEMSIQANFKPRIPPYNTMMQLYTYTKPNRQRVLEYFSELVAAKVKPTAHTYKLLMDSYGAIAPIDLKAMDNVFNNLCSDRNVSVQGTHWGALINAHGCVDKNLDRAIEIFDSISTHPTTLKSKALLPDAVAYESLINVFVTLRRADLIPKYIDRLRASGIHMTAYIANLLIKGYAVTGDLEKARSVFESLADPPQGVAALHNHTPHESDRNTLVDPNAPIYREPSTWEAMVRAELSNGNRDHALALLERMKARQFPAAVNARISGIMLDDSVSPWPAPSTSSTSPDISS